MTLRSKSFFLIVSFLINCSVFQVKEKNSYFDYNNSDFKCSNEAGWRNREDFKKYYSVIWTNVKNKYDSENIQKKQADIVVIGNSLIMLFTDDLLKKEFPGMNVVGRGIGGDMTDLLLTRIESNALSLNPRTLIIEIGGNDLIFGKCIPYIERNVVLLLEKIKSHNSNIKVIFISVPPTGSKELNAIVPIYNAGLVKILNQYNAKYIDLWPEMSVADEPVIKSEYTRPGDRIHFNEKGYELIGRLTRPILTGK